MSSVHQTDGSPKVNLIMSVHKFFKHSLPVAALKSVRLGTRRCLAVLTLVMGVASTTAFALPTVGTATIDVVDAARGRTLTTEIWFQVPTGTATEGVSNVLPIAPIQIAQNAAPASEFKKRPLIVISHGNWGTRFSQGWIAMRLVEAGYVVITPSHPGTMRDDRTTAGAVRLWDRSDDVRFVLSAVLKDARWSPLTDADRIGFWGHSFGGWTGVSLAGGRYDFKQLMIACAQQTPKDMYCDGMGAKDVTDVSLAGAGADYRDGRFKAFYLAASGPGAAMTVASLAQIRTPIRFDTAQFDTALAPAINSTALATHIPSATEVIRPVGHFVYVPLCKPLIGRVLASLICTDPNGENRASVHQQVGADVVTFFNKHLTTTH
jgi:predicted dienelactone hydrolase